jgi:hypothetical protein
MCTCAMGRDLNNLLAEKIKKHLKKNKIVSNHYEEEILIQTFSIKASLQGKESNKRLFIFQLRKKYG